MIAGEGLVGILLAIFAVLGIADKVDLSGVLNLGPVAGTIAAILVFALNILLVMKFTAGKKKA